MDHMQDHETMRTRFGSFSSVVYLLSGVSVTRTDSVSELASIDYPGAPDQLIESFHALGSNPRLFELPERVIGYLTLPHGIRFAFIRPSEDAGVVALGPYRDERDDASKHEEAPHADGQGGPADAAVATYLGGLPVMNRTQAGGVLAELANILNDTDTLLYAQRELGEAPGVTPRESEKADQIDLRQAQVIERRHHLENEILDAVASGDERRALRVLSLGEQNLGTLGGSPDALRDHQDALIILNSLMGRRLEERYVHPIFIDAISTRWCARIERVSSLSEARALPYDMTVDYCRAVRQYTMAGLSPNVRAAVSYVLEHITDDHLSLTTIASELSLSATHLSHRFSVEMGMGVRDFMTRVRIDLAREMLRRDELRSVSSIARSVGFADPSYFSRRFKAIVGCSPSEYRRRERVG